MAETVRTTCCIAGGGPAGMMLGFLLARAGVNVVVLEKHRDFLRDFRGDTIHPSTLEVFHELGLVDALLALPHDEEQELTGNVFGRRVTLADFRHLPTVCKFLVLMPQWDFLNFLASQAKRYPGFTLRMQAEVIDLLQTNGVVDGVRANTPEGENDVRATLVVGADGRHTTVRRKAELPVRDLGAPIDVLWFRLSRNAGDPAATGGYARPGFFLVLIHRSTYWQCGYVIPKGGFEAIKARGLGAFHQQIVRIAPFLADTVGELDSWDRVSLLTVQVDRLERWYKPGVLCIGDAAHAMSPVGGVGINLAIQDAVATANLLAHPLADGTLSIADLEKVERRRAWPAALTQRAQVAIANRVVTPILVAESTAERSPGLPLPLRMLERFPSLRRIPARLIGIGVRPEHVRSPAIAPAPGR